MVASANASQDASITARGVQNASKQRRLLARRSKLLQILEMQEDLKKDMQGASPIHKSALISAWDKLEERLRILRGKPLPGSLVHDKVKVTSRRALRSASGLLVDYAPAEHPANVAAEPTEPTAQPTPTDTSGTSPI